MPHAPPVHPVPLFQASLQPPSLNSSLLRFGLQVLTAQAARRIAAEAAEAASPRKAAPRRRPRVRMAGGGDSPQLGGGLSPLQSLEVQPVRQLHL